MCVTGELTVCPPFYLSIQGFPTNKPHERLESHDNMLMLIKHEDLYRRLDIICPPPDQWCVCVLWLCCCWYALCHCDLTGWLTD